MQPTDTVIAITHQDQAQSANKQQKLTEFIESSISNLENRSHLNL